jgi:hypothetical protein
MLKQMLRSSRHLTSHTSNPHIEANQTHEYIPQRVALICAARRHSCTAPNRRLNACALSAVADRSHPSIWRHAGYVSDSPTCISTACFIGSLKRCIIGQALRDRRPPGTHCWRLGRVYVRPLGKRWRGRRRRRRRRGRR